MPLNNKFVTGGENRIASYDWTELAGGSGYDTFYAISCASGSASSTNFLINSLVPSNAENIATDYSTTFSTSVNFDIELNAPRTLKGDAILVIPFFDIRNGSTRDATWNFTTSIYHYDGSTETEIATPYTSGNLTPGSSDWYQVYVINLPLTQTHFKIGDSIRLKITYAVTSTAGSGVARIGFLIDPTDENASTYGISTSATKLFVPFKINL